MKRAVKLNLQLFLTILLFASLSSAILINEFTVDPQTDWDVSGTIGNADEWIEIYNNEQIIVDLTNWTLVMNDSLTVPAAIQTLNFIIPADNYFVIQDPTGDLNFNGQILLYNNLGNLVDSVSYGNWNDGNIPNNAPNGGAVNSSDECLARFPNGIDTNVDSNDFIKTSCTYQSTNSPEENPNQQGQGLNVTISGLISLEITPTTIEFGTVQSGSQNNPALNGPIMFNANGSSADVLVEVVDVLGYPFEEGLKIDGSLATGKVWELMCTIVGEICTYEIETAEPTLDIPVGAIGNTHEGTIVYMVTGAP